MDINYKNIETLFLLYVDNELTADERLQVEQFVDENPQFRDDFMMLQQTVLTGGPEFKFPLKDVLLKSSSGINLANYEAYFILYVDEELTIAEREEVETFVLQHPELQEAFTMLRQTRLFAEHLTFPGKQLLYRQTGGLRKMVPARWVAAAALLAGVVLTIWFTKTGDQRSHDTVVSHKPQIIENRNPGTGSTAEIMKKGKTKPAVQQINQNDVAISTKLVSQPRTDRQPSPHQQPQTTTSGTRQIAELQLAALHINKVDVPDIKPTAPREIDASTQMPAQAITASTHQDAQPSIHQTVYSETDPDADEEERTILIGGAEINKSKLRGLFKKAANLLDRKLKKEDREYTVQVASFEIKTR